MLEQLYIDMNTRQPVGVQQMHAIINSTIQTVLPFTKSVENTWKHSSFVNFNIAFFTSFFPLFCKISVKGWAAELKVKTAKTFLNIEISTLTNRILNSFTSLTRICKEGLCKFQSIIAAEQTVLDGGVSPNT